MRHRSVRVGSARGLHALVAARLSARARGFSSSVYLSSGRTVSLADPLQLISLGVGPGEQVVLIADGPDEQAALDAAATVLESPDD